MDYQNVLKERRSLRKYQEHTLSTDELEEIIHEAQYAPSWKNSQTPRYYAALSTVSKQQVIDALPTFNIKSTQNASVYIITTFKSKIAGFDKNGQSDNEVGEGWGYYDTGLANMALVLSAKEHDLDTLIMGIRDANQLRVAFSIPEDEVIVSVIAIGKGALKPSMPLRLNTKDIMKIY